MKLELLIVIDYKAIIVLDEAYPTIVSDTLKYALVNNSTSILGFTLNAIGKTILSQIIYIEAEFGYNPDV